MSPIRSLLIAGLVIAALVLCAGCTQSAPAEKTTPVTLAGTPVTSVSPGTTAAPYLQNLSGRKVLLETTMGNITIALDPDMPVTAGNFETLVQKGYYDGVIFHRVISGFMIQGGDPTGTGRGGPGYTIKDEFTSHNRNSRGAVAMANTGQANSGGSQFFINLVDNSPQLNGKFDQYYPVFGNVVDGMDVVDAIGSVATSGYPNDRPLRNITIIRAVLV
jgi:peptidylprolyl isomerase